MSINYVDLAIVVIVIFSVVLGYKKGFFKTITGLVALALSLVLAIALYPRATAFVMKTPIYETVYENTAGVVQTPQTDVGVLSEFGTGKLNLPTSITDQIEQSIDKTSASVTETVAGFVASATVKLVSMLGIFLLVRIAFFAAIPLVGLIKKLPVIGWGDSLLGALFGLFRGLLLVYVLLAFMTFVASVAPESTPVRAVKCSQFARVLYHDNVLLDFINEQ